MATPTKRTPKHPIVAGLDKALRNAKPDKRAVQLSEADKAQIAEQAKAPAPKDDSFEMSEAERAAQNRAGSEQAAKNDAIVEGRTADLNTLPATGIAGSERCPHCGDRTYENVSDAATIVANGGDHPEREHTCESCGGEWGQQITQGTTQALVKVGPDNTELPKEGTEAGKCPHCGVRTHNNITLYEEMSPGSQRTTTQQFTCNDCAGEWGPVVAKAKPARAPSGTSNGLKIEANRDTQNGVTRPSTGGKCANVWAMLYDIGLDATAKQAREQAVVNGYDKTTTMVQFYRWRKFNGIASK